MPLSQPRVILLRFGKSCCNLKKKPTSSGRLPPGFDIDEQTLQRYLVLCEAFLFIHVKLHSIMALRITESCTFCGACEPECPVNAISAGDDIYVIDATACTECAGYSDTPACVGVCPAECIVGV